MTDGKNPSTGESRSDRLANGCVIALMVQWFLIFVVMGGYYLWKSGGQNQSKVRILILIVLAQTVLYLGRRAVRWYKQRRGGEKG